MEYHSVKKNKELMQQDRGHTLVSQTDYTESYIAEFCCHELKKRKLTMIEIRQQIA